MRLRWHEPRGSGTGARGDRSGARERRTVEERAGFYEALVEGAQDLVCVLREDGTVSFCSGSVRDLLGYAPEEITGRSIFSLIHPDDREMSRAALETAARRPGLAGYVVVRLRHCDGSWRVHEVSSRNMLDDPAVSGLVLNSRDITERQLVERLLSAQRDLSIRLSRVEDTMEALRVSLEAIIDASELDSGGIYILDEETGGFTLTHHVGLSEPFLALISSYDADSPRTALVKSGRSFYASYEEIPVPKDRAHLDEGIKSIAVLPIMHEGQVVGCVNLASHTAEEIDPWSRMVIEAMLVHIGETLVRVRLRKAVSDSEKHHRALIGKSRDITLVLDKNGRILYHSPSLGRVLGREEGEILGAPLFDFVHPDDLASAREGLASCAGEGDALRLEMRVRTRDGSWRRLECLCGDLRDDPVLRGLLVNARDITEQAEVEQALAESRRAFATLLSNLPGMAYRCLNDDFWTMLFVSEGGLELTGYRPEDLVANRAVSYADLIHPDDRDMVRDAVREALAAGEAFKVTYRIRTSSGGEKWVWEQGRDVGRNEHGVIILEGFITDITEKKDYERRLEEYASRMRDFMDIAAHELRHPATLLEGYASTITNRSAALSPEAFDDCLRGIHVGARRLVYVVDELLDATRIQRGAFAIDPRPTDLVAVAAGALEEIGARYRGRTLHLDIPYASVVADADRERLGRLFIILLENAVKHSPPGAPVELRGRRERGEMLFSVLDRGPGVPRGEEAKVFQRFYQVGGALHHGGPGLGLGLYIGKRIVEEHGGRIWNEPREGGGSVFSFTVPL